MDWAWRKGQGLASADLGPPVYRDGVSMCVYDATGALVFSAIARGGATSGTKACWRTTATAALFNDRTRIPRGLDKVSVKFGGAGAAQLQAKRKGKAGDPALPSPAALALPLRVQGVSDTGTCVESTFSAAGVTRQDATTLAAKSD